MGAVELSEWKAGNAASVTELARRSSIAKDGWSDGHGHGHGETGRSAEDGENPNVSNRASTSTAPDVAPAVPRPPKTDASSADDSNSKDKEKDKDKDKDVVPDAIGRETCPICIVDFEEGDDLRVLPCEGHHRFHQECVDQWLLELSSSCPICRQGASRSISSFRFSSIESFFAFLADVSRRIPQTSKPCRR